MMHGKYLILLLALLTNSMTLRAEKLTAEQALQRLQGSKYSKGVGTQRVSPLSLSYTHKSKNTNIFYAFNDTVNGGYVLLSADDTVPALLAEVSTGTFAIDNMPDNARRWLEKTSHDIELATTLSLPLFSSVTKSGNRQDDVLRVVSRVLTDKTPIRDLFNGPEKLPDVCDQPIQLEFAFKY